MLDSGNLDTYLVDKSSVLCALSIRQLEMKSAGFLSDPTLARKSKVSFIRQNRIQTLTTLSNPRQIVLFPSDSICLL